MSFGNFHFCLIGFDLGFLITGELKQQANYMTDGEFAWVRIPFSPAINATHKFGVVINDSDSDNAWVLTSTFATREEAEKAGQQLDTRAMAINLIQQV